MFIDEVISNGDFIAIHWRYDKDDWLAANCKEGVSEFMQTKCDQIHEVSFVFDFLFRKSTQDSKLLSVQISKTRTDLLAKFHLQSTS